MQNSEKDWYSIGDIIYLWVTLFVNVADTIVSIVPWGCHGKKLSLLWILDSKWSSLSSDSLLNYHAKDTLLELIDLYEYSMLIELYEYLWRTVSWSFLFCFIITT